MDYKWKKNIIFFWDKTPISQAFAEALSLRIDEMKQTWIIDKDAFKIPVLVDGGIQGHFVDSERIKNFIKETAGFFEANKTVYVFIFNISGKNSPSYVGEIKKLKEYESLELINFNDFWNSKT